MSLLSKRQAGVLLPISSLPGPFGVGDFGDNAFEFVSLLKEGGFSLWQILPLNPLGFGHSPYQPLSSFAIDEIYVSLEKLKQDGFSFKLPSPLINEGKAKIEEARNYKRECLKKAFASFDKSKLVSFKRKYPSLVSYAVYQSASRLLKTPWNKWEKPFDNPSTALKALDKETVDFELFIQYICFRQWEELHNFAKKNGVAIIGDIPFYAGYLSSDVYSNKDVFLLDKVLEPKKVSGVPPDYFSPKGQKWGNPLFDFASLKKNDFAFLKERITHNCRMYDYLRLDHFRAFDTYFAIPPKDEDASKGKWLKAPGGTFFASLFKDHPELKDSLLAEDLGLLRPEVYSLRDRFLFPGMDVIQFTFIDYEIKGEGDFNKENQISYLGTHDNDTTLSFFYSLPDTEQALIVDKLESMDIKEGPIVDRLICYLLAKKSAFAIISMQDILCLDNECRINTPGTVLGDNWLYRMKDFEGFRKRLPFLKEVIRRNKR